MQTIQNFSRNGPAAALLGLLFLFSMPLVADDSVWVRINHGADTVASFSEGVAAELNDYGAFQWGRIPAADARALESQGLRVVSLGNNPFEMVLGGERYDPLADDPAQFGFAPYQADPSGDWHIVQFAGPVRSEWLRDLRATGMQVVQPVYPFSYVVWADQAQIDAARSLGQVRWSGPKLPEHRVQPDHRGHGGEVLPTMALVSRHDLRNAVAQIESAGAVVHNNTRLSRHYEVLHLDVPGDRYMDLAQIPGVYTVQSIPQDGGPRGEMSNQSIVGGIDDDTIVPGYLDWLNPTGYDGSGVIVGVVDGGVQESHPDLVDNIEPCDGTEGSCIGASDDHGTHVAGAIAGTGASGATDGAGFLRGQGVAPGAGIVNQAYGPFMQAGGPGGMVPEGMLRIMKDSAESGALLTNNSWGPSGAPQGYDIPTMEIDFISRDALPDEPGHSPVLAVWSIMNGNGDSGGACAPSSLGSPDEAKNLFGVGSTGLQTGGGAQVPIDDVFSVSSNSGHGPACDGRTVPDIVAPGCQTDSTTVGSSHTTMCGTSMASPVVSGAVALWAERYIDETGTNPSPALMKAVFIAAAEDLVGGTNADGGTLDHRPDRFQGFGRLDLDAVMNPAGDFVYLMDQEEVFTETGQDWSLGLNAADPNEAMKIVLTWTDAPGHGDGGTAPAWVNILDLVVEANDGNTYLGNVVGPDGWSEPGGSPDGMNNTEGVWLQPGQHQGGIDLSVLATEIAGDALNPYDPGDPSQDFAIACYNCIIGDPTFSLSLDPQEAGMCVPDSGSDDAIIDISVGQIGDYSGTVALSTSGEPAGVSSLVDPDSVVVPGDSVWTLTIDDTAGAGFTEITLTGDDGEDVHTTELGLLIDETLTEGPELNAPGDGASDTSLQPQFDWNSLPDVTDYRIQIATDNGFGDVVVDEIVEDVTSFVPDDELATGTEYFWRVQGLNLCADNAWSDVFSFTTRLEPVAEFSADAFSFTVSGDAVDSDVLEISNTGTGNLNWAIVTDLPDTASTRDEHDPGLDEDLPIDSFNLPAQGSGVVTREVEAGIETRGMVIGFSFEGTVSGISGAGTWASDMQMTVTAPDGTDYTVGGFSTPHPDWDFQGSGSSSDGTYSSTHVGADIFGEEGVEDVGTWEFEFEHTWNDPMDWSDVTITLHKAPLPVCGDELTDVDWLSVNPDSGVVAQGDSQMVDVVVDSTGLASGDHIGYLCLTTNAENAPLVPMPVELTVDDGTVPGDPAAEVTPENLSATVGQDGSGVLTLNVSNAEGEAALEWEIDTAEAESGAVPAYLATPGAARGETQPVGEHTAPTVALPAPQGGPIAGDFFEGFEDISTLPSEGWAIINNRDPEGTNSWFQGDGANFPAHEGPDDSYIAANFASGDAGGIISNWLLTPEVVLENGTELRFWTMHSISSTFPDRMQVRLSTAGDSTDVGSTAESVGDFDILLEDINEDMEYPGYPEEWAEFVITIEGLSEPTSGRFGFRYYSPDWDTVGSLIGVDTLSITQPFDEVGCEFPTSIPWLSVDPNSGTVNAGDDVDVDVMLDADGLAEGTYEALLCVTTNDPDNPLIEVPVSMTVAEGDAIFEDRFEAQD